MNGSKKTVQEEGVETDVIYAYSRAQAIADGVLVGVSEVAREAGVRYPVALTHAVYEQYVRVPEGVTGQDEAGRFWDIGPSTRRLRQVVWSDMVLTRWVFTRWPPVASS